jgi:hypothetical protein
VYLNVIDQCGPPPGGYDAHFDIAPPAFRELFGDAGVNAGVQSANWQFVDASNCRGNKGGGVVPPPPPPPPTGVASSIRCGFSWSDANSKCGTPCTNDGPCGGQRCYADLSLSPCGRAVGDEDSSFSDQLAHDAAVVDFVDSTDPVAVDNAVADFVDVTDPIAVDNAVVDTVETVVADPIAVDAAVGDASFDSVGTFFDAPVEENFADFSFDAAVGDTVSTNTQQAPTTNMQGWAVALVVLFSIVIVLLLVVVVMVATALRRQV